MKKITADTTISEFIFTNRLGMGATTWKFYGSVLVTTTTPKFWGRDEKTSVRRNIYKRYGYDWCYIDDGIFLPVNTIEALVRSWEAQNEATIEEIKICRNNT